jgi:hypothetical protein
MKDEHKIISKNDQFDYTHNIWNDVFSIDRPWIVPGRHPGRVDRRGSAIVSLLEAQAASQGLGAARHTEMNDYLLMNPYGTVWQVIDGYARGYISQDIFQRHHSWDQSFSYVPIQSIDFIVQGPVWTPSTGLVSNVYGTVAIFDVDANNNGYLYGFPSGYVFNAYEMDWGAIREIGDFDYYPMPLILETPT